MAVYEALLLNTAVPQIQAAQAGDSYVMVVNATTPALRITQTGTGDAILVEDAANPDSSPFVVTAGGDVGIGTSSPAAKLHIAVASAAVDGTKGVRITNPAGTIAVFECGSVGDSFIGTTSGSDFNIRTGNTVRATFDLSGNLAIANGNLVMSTSGKGIDFSATSSGTGTMTSELLNDYEEGTWTPNYAGSTGSAGSYAVSDNSGWYTKVGNMVTVWWRLILTNKGSWTGDIEITGLPFTVANPSGTFDGANAIGVSKLTFSGYVYTEPRRNTTYISVLNVTSGSDVAILATTTVSNDSAFLGQATYFV